MPMSGLDKRARPLAFACSLGQISEQSGERVCQDCSIAQLPLESGRSLGATALHHRPQNSRATLACSRAQTWPHLHSGSGVGSSGPLDGQTNRRTDTTQLVRPPNSTGRPIDQLAGRQSRTSRPNPRANSRTSPPRTLATLIRPASERRFARGRMFHRRPARRAQLFAPATRVGVNGPLDCCHSQLD